MHQGISASRRAYNIILRVLMYLAAGLTCLLVLFLIGYVLYKGVPNLVELVSTSPSYLSGTIGILPDLLNTLYVVMATLLIVLPLGVCAAIYLTEYAANKRLVGIIEYTAETLSGIPSIIYGLVGMLFFCQFLGMKTSLWAGSMTLVIMNLPTIMRTTQESLKTVPQSYREGRVRTWRGEMARDPDGRDARMWIWRDHRLHSGRRTYPRRDGGAAVHGGLCPHALRTGEGTPEFRRDADRCALCIRQGAGRI